MTEAREAIRYLQWRTRNRLSKVHIRAPWHVLETACGRRFPTHRVSAIDWAAFRENRDACRKCLLVDGGGLMIEARTILDLTISEADFQTTVIAYAHLMGWRVHHTRPARTDKGWRTPIQGDVGFPDLVLAREPGRPHLSSPARLMVVELKAERGKLTEKQTRWLQLLDSTGIETHNFRPSDWPTIVEVLK